MGSNPIEVTEKFKAFKINDFEGFFSVLQ